MASEGPGPSLQGPAYHRPPAEFNRCASRDRGDASHPLTPSGERRRYRCPSLVALAGRTCW
eukprot:2468723-Pyramimonas_sp.AAC.1